MHISFVYFTEKRFENKKIIKQPKIPKNQRNFCRVCFSFPLGQPRPRVFFLFLSDLGRTHADIAKSHSPVSPIVSPSPKEISIAGIVIPLSPSDERYVVAAQEEEFTIPYIPHSNSPALPIIPMCRRTLTFFIHARGVFLISRSRGHCTSKYSV